ncbi:MAG: glycerol-3-phosphate 1-O-acyltransferase PlsY [Alphaproteobacteria bacterium]
MLETDFLINFCVAAVIGYGLGSVPFGLVLTKFLQMGDLRAVGSGNIGATNVLRMGSKKLAAIVLLLDGAKGAAAMGLVMLFGMATWWRDDPVMAAGLFAVFGHNFPIWLKFKGGKGVATSLGVLLMLSWQAGLMIIATWLAIAVIFRYSSLAAIIALCLSPVYMWFVTHDYPACYLALLFGFLSLVRHRPNIARLLRGAESKISFGKKD